jgi:hypothetical protein
MVSPNGSERLHRSYDGHPAPHERLTIHLPTQSPKVDRCLHLCHLPSYPEAGDRSNLLPVPHIGTTRPHPSPPCRPHHHLAPHVTAQQPSRAANLQCKPTAPPAASYKYSPVYDQSTTQSLLSQPAFLFLPSEPEVARRSTSHEVTVAEQSRRRASREEGREEAWTASRSPTSRRGSSPPTPPDSRTSCSASPAGPPPATRRPQQRRRAALLRPPPARRDATTRRRRRRQRASETAASRRRAWMRRTAAETSPACSTAPAPARTHNVGTVDITLSAIIFPADREGHDRSRLVFSYDKYIVHVQIDSTCNHYF